MHGMTSSDSSKYSIEVAFMGIDKDRWDAAGEALEELFKKPRNRQFCTILRDLMIDCRNHIHALETAQENRMALYDETERYKKEIQELKGRAMMAEEIVKVQNGQIQVLQKTVCQMFIEAQR